MGGGGVLDGSLISGDKKNNKNEKEKKRSKTKKHFLKDIIFFKFGFFGDRLKGF